MGEPGWGAAAPGVAVEQLPGTPMHVLRLRPEAAASVFASPSLAAFRKVAPNEAEGEAPRIAWMAPGEWLVTGADLKPAAIKAIAKAEPSHLADIGHGRVRFAISGERARDLLAKSCTLDLHPRAFGVGRCARTAFAQVQVLIDQISDAPVFHLYADISHAAYLRAWFEDAVVEFTFEGNDPCRPRQDIY